MINSVIGQLATIILLLQSILELCMSNHTQLCKLADVPLPMPEDEWLHTQEVMDMFGKSKKTIYNWRIDKSIKSREFGGRFLYLKSDLLRIYKRLDAQP
jgi:predicted DNA-binding transcriptional regulator AlpA